MKLGEMLRIIFTEPRSESEIRLANRHIKPDSQKSVIAAQKLKMQQQASFSFLSKLTYFSNYFLDALRPIKEKKLSNKNNNSDISEVANQMQVKKILTAEEKFNQYFAEYQNGGMGSKAEFYNINYFAYSSDCIKFAEKIIENNSKIVAFNDDPIAQADRCEAAQFLIDGYAARIREIDSGM